MKQIYTLSLIILLSIPCLSEGHNYIMIDSIAYWPTAFIQVGDFKGNQNKDILYPGKIINVLTVNSMVDNSIVEIEGQITSGNSTSAEIVDLNNNGINEIVIGQSAFPMYNGDPYVYALEYNDGIFQKVWQSEYIGEVINMWSFEEDKGKKKIAIYSKGDVYEHILYFLEFDGKYLLSQPIILEGPVVYVGKINGSEYNGVVELSSKLSLDRRDMLAKLRDYETANFRGVRLFLYGDLKLYKINNNLLLHSDLPIPKLNSPIWDWVTLDLTGNGSLEYIIGTFDDGQPSIKIFQQDNLLYCSPYLDSNQSHYKYLGFSTGNISPDKDIAILTTTGHRLSFDKEEFKLDSFIKGVFDTFPTIFQIHISDITKDGKDDIVFLAGSTDEDEFLIDYKSYLYKMTNGK